MEEVQQDKEKKLQRELARKRTVVRLMKENVGSTLHAYKTPSGRSCYRLLTGVDAPVPRDPLLNVAKRTVKKLLDSGRLLQQEDNSIILNINFKNKKNGNDKEQDNDKDQSSSESQERRQRSHTRPQTGSLFE